MSDAEVAPIINLPLARLCADYLRSEAGQKMVEKHIADTCEQAVKNVTGYSSQFRKDLEAMFEQTLKVPLDFDFTGYQQTVLNIMRHKAQHLSSEVLQKRIAEQMEELLEPAPDKIKLSEIAEQYVADLREAEKDESGCVCYDGKKKEATILFDADRHGTSGFYYMELSSEPNVKRHSGEITMGFYRNKLFSLRFKDIATESQLFVGKYHGFARKLFQMKVAETHVEMDQHQLDRIETYYGNDHDD